jgi:hypothetical protein
MLHANRSAATAAVAAAVAATVAAAVPCVPYSCSRSARMTDCNCAAIK